MNEELKNKREKQEFYNCLITLLLFIIQGIALPIMYVNNICIEGVPLIKMTCIICIAYYILKQLFFSEMDFDDTTHVFVYISGFWFIILVVGGVLLNITTKIITIDQLFEGLGTVVTSLLTTSALMVLINIVDSFQEFILENEKEANLEGYKQKTYQLIETTKCFIGFIVVLTVIFLVVAPLRIFSLATINWEKSILYLGTPYCIVILGILLRLD